MNNYTLFGISKQTNKQKKIPLFGKSFQMKIVYYQKQQEYAYEIEHSEATRMKHVDAQNRNVPIAQSVLFITRLQRKTMR